MSTRRSRRSTLDPDGTSHALKLVVDKLHPHSDVLLGSILTKSGNDEATSLDIYQQLFIKLAMHPDYASLPVEQLLPVAHRTIRWLIIDDWRRGQRRRCSGSKGLDSIADRYSISIKQIESLKASLRLELSKKFNARRLFVLDAALDYFAANGMGKEYLPQLECEVNHRAVSEGIETFSQRTIRRVVRLAYRTAKQLVYESDVLLQQEYTYEPESEL